MSFSNRVAILDDDESLVEVLKLFLDEEFETHAFTHPNSALEFLATEDVHCMVMDYHMGEEGGLKLIKKVSAQFPDLSILVLSGDVAVAEEVRALRNPKIAYQPKPVTMNRLTSVIQNMINDSHYSSPQHFTSLMG